MIFSKDFDLFSAIQKVRLSEKTSEILGQVSEKMKLESLAGLVWRVFDLAHLTLGSLRGVSVSAVDDRFMEV